MTLRKRDAIAASIAIVVLLFIGATAMASVL